MTRAETTQRRHKQREQALQDFQSRSAVALATLDEGQRWLLFAALNLVALLGPISPLRRVVAFLLCHCGLGLKLQVVCAALQLSPRALTSLRKTQPVDLMRSLRSTRPGKTPKLLPEHVGPVARFLVDHPKAPVSDVLDFVHKELGISIQRHALHRFLLRYSLGKLT